MNQGGTRTVHKNGDTYVIDGGDAGYVISDVCLDSRDAAGYEEKGKAGLSARLA